MRILTLNLNGIRSAVNKGFLDWLPRQQADVVCVQEIKAQAADLTPAMRKPDGYHGYFHFAAAPGLQRRRHLLPARSPMPSSRGSASPTSTPRGATWKPASAN